MEGVEVGSGEVERDLVSFFPTGPESTGVDYFCCACGCRNELDLDDSGSLNREAFVQGMWRIDEELRKQRNKPSFNTRLRLPPSRATTLLI